METKANKFDIGAIWQGIVSFFVGLWPFGKEGKEAKQAGAKPEKKAAPKKRAENKTEPLGTPWRAIIVISSIVILASGTFLSNVFGNLLIGFGIVAVVAALIGLCYWKRELIKAHRPSGDQVKSFFGRIWSFVWNTPGWLWRHRIFGITGNWRNSFPWSKIDSKNRPLTIYLVGRNNNGERTWWKDSKHFRFQLQDFVKIAIAFHLIGSTASTILNGWVFTFPQYVELGLEVGIILVFSAWDPDKHWAELLLLTGVNAVAWGQIYLILMQIQTGTLSGYHYLISGMLVSIYHIGVQPYLFNRAYKEEQLKPESERHLNIYNTVETETTPVILNDEMTVEEAFLLIFKRVSDWRGELNKGRTEAFRKRIVEGLALELNKEEDDVIILIAQTLVEEEVQNCHSRDLRKLLQVPA